MVTSTDLLFSRLVTRTFVPKGKVLCAPVVCCVGIFRRLQYGPLRICRRRMKLFLFEPEPIRKAQMKEKERYRLFIMKLHLALQKFEITIKFKTI